MDSIDLDNIVKKEMDGIYNGYASLPGGPYISLHNVKRVMQEAIRQALVLASEKAELEEEVQNPKKNYEVISRNDLGYEHNVNDGPFVNSIKVKKQSIFDIEKLVKY